MKNLPGLILLFLTALFFSCSTISYKEAPPKEIAELDSFPPELIGAYISNETTNEKGIKLTPAESECQKKSFPVFEIMKNGIFLHDYRSTTFSKNKKDTLISKITESLIYIKENGKDTACRYFECDGKYHVLTRDHSLMLKLGMDSIDVKPIKELIMVKLKTFKGYYFFSFGSEQKWTSLIFRSLPGKKIKLLVRKDDKKQEILNDKLRKYTPVYVVETEKGKRSYINPDTTQLMKMLRGTIFTKSMEFKKKE
ncbi:MAG: hypothetical protein IAF38_13560 [Bacteroidia bacterium]|nr:hypothetical protein [Bacteroidia bacterium]